MQHAPLDCLQMDCVLLQVTFGNLCQLFTRKPDTIRMSTGSARTQLVDHA